MQLWMMGRLANHSKRGNNIVPKLIEIDSTPHIIFNTIKDIEVGMELLWDYGVTDQEELDNSPFLKN